MRMYVAQKTCVRFAEPVYQPHGRLSYRKRFDDKKDSRRPWGLHSFEDGYNTDSEQRREEKIKWGEHLSLFQI